MIKERRADGTWVLHVSPADYDDLTAEVDNLIASGVGYFEIVNHIGERTDSAKL